MRLGISSYTVPWAIGIPGYPVPRSPLTLLGLIEKTHELGLSLLQIADNISLPSLKNSELIKARDLASHLNVAIEVGTRGTNPDNLLEYLDFAQFFDAKICRTIIVQEDFAQAKANLRSVLPRFEESDVTLAIENHGLQTVSQLVGMFQEFDSPYIGSCVDTVNSFGALEGPEVVLSALVPYIVNLHIKDFAIGRSEHMLGFSIYGTPAGEGRLNIPDILKTISKYEKFPTAILELWTPWSGLVEDTVDTENTWLTKSLTYLRQLSFE